MAEYSKEQRSRNASKQRRDRLGQFQDENSIKDLNSVGKKVNFFSKSSNKMISGRLIHMDSQGYAWVLPISPNFTPTSRPAPYRIPVGTIGGIKEKASLDKRPQADKDREKSYIRSLKKYLQNGGDMELAKGIPTRENKSNTNKELAQFHAALRKVLTNGGETTVKHDGNTLHVYGDRQGEGTPHNREVYIYDDNHNELFHFNMDKKPDAHESQRAEKILNEQLVNALDEGSKDNPVDLDRDGIPDFRDPVIKLDNKQANDPELLKDIPEGTKVTTPGNPTPRPIVDDKISEAPASNEFRAWVQDVINPQTGKRQGSFEYKLNPDNGKWIRTSPGKPGTKSLTQAEMDKVIKSQKELEQRLNKTDLILPMDPDSGDILDYPGNSVPNPKEKTNKSETKPKTPTKVKNKTKLPSQDEKVAPADPKAISKHNLNGFTTITPEHDFVDNIKGYDDEVLKDLLTNPANDAYRSFIFRELAERNGGRIPEDQLIPEMFVRQEGDKLATNAKDAAGNFIQIGDIIQVKEGFHLDESATERRGYPVIDRSAPAYHNEIVVGQAQNGRLITVPEKPFEFYATDNTKTSRGKLKKKSMGDAIQQYDDKGPDKQGTETANRGYTHQNNRLTDPKTGLPILQQESNTRLIKRGQGEKGAEVTSKEQYMADGTAVRLGMAVRFRARSPKARKYHGGKTNDEFFGEVINMAPAGHGIDVFLTDANGNRIKDENGAEIKVRPSDFNVVPMDSEFDAPGPRSNPKGNFPKELPAHLTRDAGGSVISKNRAVNDKYINERATTDQGNLIDDRQFPNLEPDEDLPEADPTEPKYGPVKPSTLPEGAPELELEHLEPTDENVDRFIKAINASKDQDPNGDSVYVYPKEEYKEMELFLNKDNSAGVAVKPATGTTPEGEEIPDGDIVSVFSNKSTRKEGNNLPALLQVAQDHGGNKLGAFEGKLTEFYESHGFKEYKRDEWDDQYAPDDWDYDKNGTPAVVYLEKNEVVRTGDSDSSEPTETDSNLEEVDSDIPDVDAPDVKVEVNTKPRTTSKPRTKSDKNIERIRAKRAKNASSTRLIQYEDEDAEREYTEHRLAGTDYKPTKDWENWMSRFGYATNQRVFKNGQSRNKYLVDNAPVGFKIRTSDGGYAIKVSDDRWELKEGKGGQAWRATSKDRVRKYLNSLEDQTHTLYSPKRSEYVFNGKVKTGRDSRDKEALARALEGTVATKDEVRYTKDGNDWVSPEGETASEADLLDKSTTYSMPETSSAEEFFAKISGDNEPTHGGFVTDGQVVSFTEDGGLKVIYTDEDGDDLIDFATPEDFKEFMDQHSDPSASGLIDSALVHKEFENSALPVASANHEDIGTDADDYHSGTEIQFDSKDVDGFDGPDTTYSLKKTDTGWVLNNDYQEVMALGAVSSNRRSKFDTKTSVNDGPNREVATELFKDILANKVDPNNVRTTAPENRMERHETGGEALDYGADYSDDDLNRLVSEGRISNYNFSAMDIPEIRSVLADDFGVEAPIVFKDEGGNFSGHIPDDHSSFKESLAAVADFYEKFPTARKPDSIVLSSGPLDDGALGLVQETGNGLNLSISHQAANGKYDIGDTGDNNPFTLSKTDPSKSTVYHELTHVMDHGINDDDVDFERKNEHLIRATLARMFGVSASTVSEMSYQEILERLNKDFDGFGWYQFQPLDLKIDNPSYQNINTSETVAESIADVMQNGDRAKSVSKEVAKTYFDVLTSKDLAEIFDNNDAQLTELLKRRGGE